MSRPAKRPRYGLRSRRSPSPDEPATIQEPKYSDVIIHIANRLDPKSLVNFSMTCKSVHAACQKAKPNFFVNRKLMLKNKPKFTTTWLPMTRGPMDETLKKASERFVVRLAEISFEDEVDDAFLQSTRRYLDQYKVKSINCVSVEASCSNPQGLLKFVLDYQVSDLLTETCFPDDVLKSLLDLGLDSFGCTNNVKINIAELSLPVLFLAQTKVKPKMFKDILRKFVNDTSLMNWTVGVTSWDSTVDCVREIKNETNFPPATAREAEPRLTRTYCYGAKRPVQLIDKEGRRVECSWGYGKVHLTRQKKYKKKSD